MRPLEHTYTVSEYAYPNPSRYSNNAWIVDATNAKRRVSPQWTIPLTDFIAAPEAQGKLCYFELKSIYIDSNINVQPGFFTRIPWTISINIPQFNSYSSINNIPPPNTSVIDYQYGTTMSSANSSVVVGLSNVQMDSHSQFPRVPIQIPYGPFELVFSLQINFAGPGGSFYTAIAPSSNGVPLPLIVSTIFSLTPVE